MNPNPNPNSEEVKYKGVRKRKWGKWVSEIRLPHSRERIWLGSYDTPQKAARAFDAAQFCLRGRAAANFNFPDNPPEIEGGQTLTPAEIQIAAARFANAVQEQNPVQPLPEVTEDHAPSWESGFDPYYEFNYEAEFGLVEPGLGDFYGSHQPDFGYDTWNNASDSHGSFLWNF